MIDEFCVWPDTVDEMKDTAVNAVNFPRVLDQPAVIEKVIVRIRASLDVNKRQFSFDSQVVDSTAALSMNDTIALVFDETIVDLLFVWYRLGQLESCVPVFEWYLQLTIE